MGKNAIKTISALATSAYTLVILLSGKVFAAVSGGVAGGALEAKGDDQPTDLFGATGIFTRVTNTLLFAVGIISVVMLIYGGIRYTTSAGEAARVTGAKNTVMYAIIGLIVSILAYAIVNFVIGNLING